MKFCIFLLAGAAVLLLDQTKCVCADSSTLDRESEMASHIDIVHEHGHHHSGRGLKLQVKGKNGVPNVMDRHLKKCNPKKVPFRLYDTFLGDESERIEICQRGCPDFFHPSEFVVPGSTASKTAKECCDKYPDTSPEGYCFNVDQACVCEKQPFYHFINDGGSSCVRGCGIIESDYYYFGLLPSSPTPYTTGEECCKDKGCSTDIDGTEALFDYCCDPKEQPFYVYSGEFLLAELGSNDICTRVCPREAYGLTLAQGSKASKTAKECCAKNPDTSPEGFCFEVDEACFKDKQLCEKELWYHYDFIRPSDNSRVLACGRGCSFVPSNYYRYGVLPTSTTGYTTADECCAENECEFTRDFCSDMASTSSAKATTTNPKFSALGIMTEGVGFGHAFGLMDDVDEDKGLFV